MCADSDSLQIKTPADEYMGNLPGVTRKPIPCKAGETLMIQRITLDPGATIPLHYHLKRQETYFGTLGEGVVIVNGQEHKFGVGGLQRVSIPRQTVHGLRNDSDMPFVFVAVYNVLCEDGTKCVCGDTYLD